ncbi:MAG: hypothetical protein LBV51_05365 [Acholeplasmatales bacterium]|jgi:hypothetical protein|nr:hypothetical protein [Acholeplasmatales bacterium]
MKLLTKIIYVGILALVLVASLVGFFIAQNNPAKELLYYSGETNNYYYVIAKIIPAALTILVGVYVWFFRKNSRFLYITVVLLAGTQLVPIFVRNDVVAYNFSHIWLYTFLTYGIITVLVGANEFLSVYLKKFNFKKENKDVKAVHAPKVSK